MEDLIAWAYRKCAQYCLMIVNTPIICNVYPIYEWPPRLPRIADGALPLRGRRARPVPRPPAAARRRWHPRPLVPIVQP